MVSGLAHIYVDGQLISATKGERELWIESKDIEIGGRAHKYLDTFVVELKSEGSSTARIQLGWRDRLEDPIKWGKWFPLSDADTMHWTRVTARYFRVRIEDKSAETIWKLSALEFFGQVMGGRL